jgi:hypothetical protein
VPVDGRAQDDGLAVDLEAPGSSVAQDLVVGLVEVYAEERRAWRGLERRSRVRERPRFRRTGAGGVAALLVVTAAPRGPSGEAQAENGGCGGCSRG